MLLVHTPCERRATYAEIVELNEQISQHLQLGLGFGCWSAGFLVQRNRAIRCALSKENDLNRQIVPAKS